jgi:hypothetical protein
MKLITHMALKLATIKSYRRDSFANPGEGTL